MIVAITDEVSQDLYGRMSKTGGAPGLFEAEEQDQWDHLVDMWGAEDGDESMEAGDGRDTSGKRRRLE